MNAKYSISIIAVAAAMVLASMPAHAQHKPVMSQVSGEIDWIDVQLGTLKLTGAAEDGRQGTREYRISQKETRVTDPTDKEYLVIKDLKAGQFITMDVIKGGKNEEMLFVQRIIVDPGSTHDSPEVPGAKMQAKKDRGSDAAGLTGPRGATGPAGTAGEKGLAGVQGSPGVALTGKRGEQGLAGSAGKRGATGPRGPAGDIVRGSAGEVGPTGSRGAQGEMGKSGKQGGSLAAAAGPRGAVGSQGERGPVGDAGAKGATTYGPTGPAGHAGAAGAQGAVGKEGSQGSTTAGIAGVAGPSGTPGATGAKGATGEQGIAGQVDEWVSYREFNFTSDETALSNADLKMVDDIATYLKKNPSLQIGIDGTAVKASDQGLNDRRVSAIRSGLIKAGIPAKKISMGEIGDKGLRQAGRIALFLTTAQPDDSLSKN